jgi:hypothetical protein
MRHLLLGVVLTAAVLSAIGCSKFLDDLTAPTPKTQTGEQFCATLPRVNGNLFFCGTVQGNLQGVPSPNQGYCMAALSNGVVGLVGYSATTFSGGAFPVNSFAGAQDDCNAVNGPGLRQCGSIIRCTRE